MIDPKVLTIIFTTFNQLDHLMLAIHSFLEFYPQYRESIKVFDDESDIRIEEWLNEEKIERITWKNKSFVSSFSSYTKIYPARSTSLRNSLMITEILSNHVSTKYVMINDNDIVFLKPGFMEDYEELVSAGYKAIAPLEEYSYGWEVCSRLSPPLMENYLGKYFKLYNHEKKSMRRLHWCHGLMDFEYFRDMGIIFDGQVDRRFIWLVLQGSIVETGTEFFYKILENKIPYYGLDRVYNRLVC